MATEEDPGRPAIESRTPKYDVTCQTCRVSKSFLTLQGVNLFFLDHEGHKVIQGTLFEPGQTVKRPYQTVEEVAKLQESAPEVGPWSAELVAREKVPEVEGEVVAPALEEPEAPPQRTGQPAEAHMKELLDRLQSAERPGGTEEGGSKPAKEETHEVPAGPGKAIFLEFRPQLEEEGIVAVREEAELPPQREVQPAVVQQEPPAAAIPLLSEKELKEPLLLARSSYIESDEKRADALRVSRALREFKWNAEPPYVIGIMVDDSLSVETNIGVVSSAMVEKVEQLGYAFVGVNAPQGTPVAWFKKGTKGELGKSLAVGDVDKIVKTGEAKRP